MKRQTTVFENSLIWLGAGISIAEIQTGTYIAPLGFPHGLLAIILGHLIGCSLLFLAGLIGGRTRKSAMETVALSFGQRGALLFAFLNICQLVGWTGIMIYDGAAAAEELFHCGKWLWCLVIGLLIIFWLKVGIRHLGKVNIVAMAALMILTGLLCWNIFSHHQAASLAGTPISFGAAVELAVSMPLSWLPLISDYTSKAQKALPATMASTIAYGLVSCWMDIIGMGASILTGQTSIAKVIFQAGMGIAGLIIIVFSTVTTTFMDAYSAGTSSSTIWHRVNGTAFAIITTIVGTIGAIYLPMDNITNFLYLIGSVFAPMIAILVTDYYLLHRSLTKQLFNWPNLIVWLVGFIIYRCLMLINTPVGNTFPDMVIVCALCLLWHSLSLRLKR